MLRRHGSAVALLAIKPAGSDRWQLPKGIVERGEAPEVAALREVAEEGGVEAEILSALEPITYFFRRGAVGFRKTVHIFAMRRLADLPAGHDHEVDEVRWLAADEVDLLTFDSERNAAREALSLLPQLDK